MNGSSSYCQKSLNIKQMEISHIQKARKCSMFQKIGLFCFTNNQVLVEIKIWDFQLRWGGSADTMGVQAPSEK